MSDAGHGTAREQVDPSPIEATLTAVDDALARLDKGTYGTCSVCGDSLGDVVLEADPFATFCEGHLPGTLTPA